MLNVIYSLPLFLGNLRGMQLVIVIIVVLLLFGGKKIPEMMRTMGKGVHSFKQGLAEAKEEINKPVETPAPKKEESPADSPTQSSDQK